MTTTSDNKIKVSQQTGRVIGFLFSLFIIYSITISVIDEANARFAAIAFGFTVVLFSAPLAQKAKSGRTAIFFWLVDLVLAAGFIFSGWWFYAVKEDLWTGFYTASPMNVTAGIIGIVVLLETARRSWGWSLVIMALVFFAFGFSGPYLPGILKHLAWIWPISCRLSGTPLTVCSAVSMVLWPIPY